MNPRKLLSFLAITLGVSAFSIYWLLNWADSLGAIIFFSLLYLWAPGLAALITHKALYGGSMKDYGFRSGRLSLPWLLGSILAPLGAVAGTLGVVFLMGNLLHLPGFGRVVPGGTIETGSIFSYWEPAGSVFFLLEQLPLSLESLLSAPASLTDFFQVIFVSILLGVFIGGPLMLLPEIGWRGLLQSETQSKGFLGGGLLTGLGWSAWALMPFVMIGYFDLFEWTLVAANLTALSFVLSYLSLKCGNIAAPVLFRGVLSTTGGLTLLFLKDADPLLSSIGGVAGTIFFMFVTYLILINDKDFVERFASMRYRGE